MDNSDYTLDDLLKLIEAEGSETDPEPLLKTSSLDSFIKQYNLHKGVDRIASFVLYYVYKIKFGGEMSKIAFFREFAKHFDQVRTGKQRCYMVTADELGIDRELLIEAEFHNKGSKK